MVLQVKSEISIITQLDVLLKTVETMFEEFNYNQINLELSVDAEENTSHEHENCVFEIILKTK